MNLHGLIEAPKSVPGFNTLVERLSTEGSSSSVSVIDAAKPLLLAALWHRLKRPLVVITDRMETAHLLHQQMLAYLGGRAPIYVLPELDSLPYERLGSDRNTIHQRMAALQALNQRIPSGQSEAIAPIVIGSAYGFSTKTADPKQIKALSHTISRGERLDLLATIRQWTLMGYRVEPAVELPGDLSRRGGILDVFPPSSSNPVRLDFFDDTIDTIRYFDPESQRSLDPLQSIVITPATELIPQAEPSPQLT